MRGQEGGSRETAYMYVYIYIYMQKLTQNCNYNSIF